MSFTPRTARAKNNTASPIVLMGLQIDPGQYYTLQGLFERIQWARDPQINAWLLDGTIVMNDGVRDITDPEGGKNLLRAVRRSNLAITVQSFLINLTSYSTNGRAAWLDMRNTSYRDGVCIIDYQAGAVPAQVRVVDATRNVVLGTSPVLSSTGIYEIPFDNPAGDARIEIQSRVTSILGILAAPSLVSITLEWNT